MRSTRRANPLLPWAAGAVLSILVLALTVVDEGWLERVAGRSSATSDQLPATLESPLVVVPLESAAPPAPDLATLAPESEVETEAAPFAAPQIEPAPFGKTPPRIVPISPDGRGTAATGARPEALRGTPAPEPPVAPPQPDTAASRVIPISLERPRAPLSSGSPGVQLVGAVATDDDAGGDLIDLGPESADAAPAASASAGIRLFIHYRATQAAEAATATRLAEYLRRRGFEVAAIRPVESLIERPGVRFFFERDHAESQRLLEDLDWFFRGMQRQAPERASDFTHYTPKPNPGTIEIWLPASS